MNNFGKVLGDVLVFVLIFIVGKIIISADIFYRSTAEKVLFAFLIVASVGFTYLRNRPNLFSILYGLLIVFVLAYAVDSNNFTKAIISLVGIIGITFGYYALTSNIKSNNKNTSLDDLVEIGTKIKEIGPELFIEGKEMNLNKSAYSNYKPILIRKTVKQNGDIILDYSNKDDLNFTLVIYKKVIDIKHKKKVKNESDVNKYVMEFINNIC